MVEVVRAGLRYLVPASIGLVVALADLGNVDLLFAGTFLLLMGFVVGWWWPGQWWLSGLLMGGVLPLVQLWALLVRFPMPYVPDPLQGLFLLGPALLMAGFGAVVHRKTPYAPTALRSRLRRAKQADDPNYEEP
ncbi:hypothetical protein [Meiothermus rufus]|uniref:hypothetical protein n=1 Tax=Meiothermus rufus TaxID=604332 RepID=UPI000404DB75|nr:hypothetical protein [Meiothermus rufus]